MSQTRNRLAANWRPLSAYTYMIIVLFDFIIAPILWVGVHVYLNLPIVSWEPLTLQSGGMFHLAMGAVMGVSSYTRGQEKVETAKQPTTVVK